MIHTDNFILIMNQIEFRLVHNRKGNRQCGHNPFNLKVNKNLSLQKKMKLHPGEAPSQTRHGSKTIHCNLYELTRVFLTKLKQTIVAERIVVVFNCCIYNFLIDFESNGIPFGSESIGKW